MLYKDNVSNAVQCILYSVQNETENMCEESGKCVCKSLLYTEWL